MSDVSIVPMMAGYPITHMGHIIDIVSELDKLPGKKIIGLSKDNGVFFDQFRKNIFELQMDYEYNPEIIFVSSAGETLKYAYAFGKNLHVLTGHDRKSNFAERLKSCIETGKIKELEGLTFDSVELHYPTSERLHGLSGTKMRQAAIDDDLHMFHRHFGYMFDVIQANSLMDSFKDYYNVGRLKINRNK